MCCSMFRRWCNSIKTNLMSFKDIFKDHNDFNEKSIIGFISFSLLVLTLLLDILTGWFGKELAIHQFIFDGFLVLTLGSFGIASIDKFVALKNTKGKPDQNNTNYSNNIDEIPLK